jgi:hypothetical protein
VYKFRRHFRWRSRAPFSLFKLSGESRRALGVPIWEIKRSEIALVNRRECANLGDTFGVPRWEEPLYIQRVNAVIFRYTNTRLDAAIANDKKPEGIDDNDYIKHLDSRLGMKRKVSYHHQNYHQNLL